MPIREAFWNIPHWAEIGQYVLAFLTVAVFTWGVIRRILRWRMGQPALRSERFGKRVGRFVAHGVAQLRTAEEGYPGIMHLMIFWGMVILLIGTILATIDWDVTHLFFGFQFLTGMTYNLFECSWANRASASSRSSTLHLESAVHRSMSRAWVQVR